MNRGKVVSEKGVVALIIGKNEKGICFILKGVLKDL